MRALALFACSLTLAGCFDMHGRHDDDDGGTPIDSGRFFTDCHDALWSGASGDACSFAESCSDIAPCSDEPTREVMCLGGRLQFFTRTCTLAPWERCEDYVAGFPREGLPGEACFEHSFGECTVATDEPCCDRIVTCSSGIVSDEVSCRRGCIEGPTCEGYEPPPPELPLCRTSAECERGEPCVPPGTPRACGICMPTPHECTSSADCAAGDVCVHEPVPCTCDGDLGTFCRPACTVDSCDEGERCGSDGLCAPIHCSEGYACSDNTRCETTSTPAGPIDAHGCWRLPCTGDAECDCGACVEAYCYDGPGLCQPPVP